MQAVGASDVLNPSCIRVPRGVGVGVGVDVAAGVGVGVGVAAGVCSGKVRSVGC